MKLQRTILLTLTLALALPSFAQPPRGIRGNGDGQQFMRTELNLTAEQEQQMQELRFKKEAQAIDLRAELQLERLKLRKLRQTDDPNKKKLYAQVDKIGAIEVKLDKARIDHMLKVKKVLTADQFKTFRQIMTHRMGPRDGQRGNKWDNKPKHFRPDRY